MGMMTVLIADDDSTMRISLKTLVAWQEHGYQVIGEVADGKAALDICRRQCPDILITDMKMPEMDGIALLHALKEENLTPYIVVLSGYDDFHLVRDAMRLGAADYLLKLELEPCRLLELLSAAQPREQPEPNRISSAEQERLLRELISHFYINENQFEQQLHEAGIVFPDTQIWCMLVKADAIYRFEEVSDEDCYTLQLSIRNIAEEIINDGMTAYFVGGKTGELYVYAYPHEEYRSIPDFVQSIAGRLQEMLLRYLDIPCVIGLSQSGSAAHELSESARAASTAVQYRFWTEDTVLEAGKQIPKLLKDRDADVELQAQIITAFTALDDDAVRVVFDCMQEKLWCSTALPEMTQAAVELYSGIREAVARLGQQAENILPNSMKSVREILEMQSIGTLKQWIDALQKDVLTFIRSSRENTEHNPIVYRVCSMIGEMFSDDISIQQIAAELELSPGYLSALLKKHTGKNFTEYVTGVRIEHAKQLLKQTNEKIYSIAVQTGFSDQYYFSRIFKRITGTTPGEWRKQAQMEELL